MCTAMSDNRECHLFGRTLDLECSFGERIVRIGRNFKLNFLREKASVSHYAIIGTAHIYEGMPFFYDAANEKGLAMAALNFPGLAVYREPRSGVLNLASFELIWWVLSKCSDLSEARIELKRVNVTSDAISDTMPATPLHWMLADKSGAIVIEPTQDGIKIYDAPFGIMTNSPEYPYHILRISECMSLCPEQPENRISPRAKILPYSRGMGAIGLPGDASSSSRFIRAVYTKSHTVHGEGLSGEVSRFFHVMDTVAQPRGFAVTDEGKSIYTVYTSCIDLDTVSYYFTTYGCRRIRGVKLFDMKSDTDVMETFAMELSEDVLILSPQESNCRQSL